MKYSRNTCLAIEGRESKFLSCSTRRKLHVFRHIFLGRLTYASTPSSMQLHSGLDPSASGDSAPVPLCICHIPVLASALSSFQRCIFGYNSGHFFSTTETDSIPFNVVHPADIRPTYRALLKEYTSFSASSTLPSWFVNQPNESSWYLSCLAHVFFHHVDIIYSAWQHVTSNAKLTSIYQFNVELK